MKNLGVHLLQCQSAWRQHCTFCLFYLSLFVKSTPITFPNCLSLWIWTCTMTLTRAIQTFHMTLGLVMITHHIKRSHKRLRSSGFGLHINFWGTASSGDLQLDLADPIQHICMTFRLMKKMHCHATSDCQRYRCSEDLSKNSIQTHGYMNKR